MLFKDVSQYDLDLIKSLSIQRLIHTNVSDRYEAIAEEVLGYIYAKGFKIEPYPKDLVIKISKRLNCEIYQKLDAVQVIKGVFEFLETYSLQILQDNREPTWSEPRPSWYTSDVKYKKPWVF